MDEPDSPRRKKQLRDCRSKIEKGDDDRPNMYTLCVIHSVLKFCFVLDMKSWLPIGLHSSCSISATASGTCQNV